MRWNYLKIKFYIGFNRYRKQINTYTILVEFLKRNSQKWY